ncbi:MAG: hypothetical protein ABSE51_17845 [Terracidiphilus sp.]|jgi:hypothetical protein
MFDYSKLADYAKLTQVADQLAIERHNKLKGDRCAFFDKIRAHLIEEMKKANAELRKRGAAALIDQNHLPTYSEELFLTYGTDSLCRVGLGVRGGGCQITAVISGPPNGYEISKKEYTCSQDKLCGVILSEANGRKPAAPSLPDEIAIDIVSAILMGRFN